MKLGSRFKRFIAYMLDSVVLYGVFIALNLLLVQYPHTLGLISWILALVYYTAFEQSKYQATPGKALLKLYVSDLDGKRLSTWRALIRYLLGFYIPFLPLAVILITLYMSPEIMSAAQTLSDVKVSEIVDMGGKDFKELVMGMVLLTVAKPVLTFSMFGLWAVLALTWFIPILFKSRRGTYERISKTVVLRR